MSMERDQCLVEYPISGDDQLVKTGEGYLIEITVSWSGAAAGQSIVIRDGLTNTAPFMVPIVLPSATGTLQLMWRYGKRFTTGLFLDFQGAGQIQGELQYR